MLYLVNFYQKKRNFKKIYCIHVYMYCIHVLQEEYKEKSGQNNRIKLSKNNKITLFHKQFI